MDPTTTEEVEQGEEEVAVSIAEQVVGDMSGVVAKIKCEVHALTFTEGSVLISSTEESV